VLPAFPQGKELTLLRIINTVVVVGTVGLLTTSSEPLKTS
jgi:hypothetical protein